MNRKEKKPEMKKFQVTVASGRLLSSLTLNLPSLEAQVVVRFQNGNDVEERGEGSVLTAELHDGEHRTIGCEPMDKSMELPSVSLLNDDNIGSVHSKDKYDVGGDHPTEIATYPSRNAVCPGYVDSSQCEDEIQTISAIPGLYGGSSPEIVVATEPQDQDSFWEGVPSTQQDEPILKPSAENCGDNPDSDEEIIDSTDDEATTAVADNSTKVSSDDGINDKSSVTLESTSVAEKPHKQATTTVTDMKTVAGEQPKTTPSPRKETQRPTPLDVATERKDSDTCDSDDSFVGKGSTSSRRRTSIGATKNFVKKRAVYFSSEDSEDSGDDNEDNAEKKSLGEKALPDLESQMVVESTEQHCSVVPETVSVMEQRPDKSPQQDEPPVQELSSVPAANAPDAIEPARLTTSAYASEMKPPNMDGSIEGTERESQVALKRVGDNNNDLPAAQRQDVVSENDDNPVEVVQEGLSQEQLPRVQLVEDTPDGDQVQEKVEAVVTDEKEVEIPDTDEQKLADSVENLHEATRKSPQKQNDKTDKIFRSISPKKQNSVSKAPPPPNRVSIVSVDTQESLKLTILSESLNKENDEHADADITRDPRTSSPIYKHVPNEKARGTPLGLQTPERDNRTDDVDADVPPTPSGELDISAASMLERLEKLKNRKSAWEQAKEDLQAEGLLVDGQPDLRKGRVKTSNNQRMVFVERWLTDNEGYLDGPMTPMKICENDVKSSKSGTSKVVIETTVSNDCNLPPSNSSRGSSPVVETISQVPHSVSGGALETPAGPRKRASSESNVTPVAKKKRGRTRKTAVTNTTKHVNKDDPSVTEMEPPGDTEGKSKRMSRKCVKTVSSRKPTETMPAEEEEDAAVGLQAEASIEGHEIPLSCVTPNDIAVTDSHEQMVTALSSSPEKTSAVSKFDGSTSAMVPSSDMVVVSETVPLEHSTVGLTGGSSVEETPTDKKHPSPVVSVSMTSMNEMPGTSAELTIVADKQVVEQPTLVPPKSPVSHRTPNVKQEQHINRQRSLYHSQELSSQSPFESILDQSQNRYAVGNTPREVASVSCTRKRIPIDVRRVFSPSGPTSKSPKSATAEHRSSLAKADARHPSGLERTESKTPPSTPRRSKSRTTVELTDSSDDGDVITVASTRPSPMAVQPPTSTRKPQRTRTPIVDTTSTPANRRMAPKAFDSDANGTPLPSTARRSMRSRSRTSPSGVIKADGLTPANEVLVPETVEATPQMLVENSDDEQENVVLKEAIVVLENSALTVVEETPDQASDTQNSTRSRRATRVRSDARLKRVVKSLSSSKQDPTLSQSDPYARDTIDVGATNISREESPPAAKARNVRRRNAQSVKQNPVAGDGSATASSNIVPFSEEISPPQVAETEPKTRPLASEHDAFKQPKNPPQRTRSTRGRPSETQAAPQAEKGGRRPGAKGKRAHSPEESSSVQSKKSRPSLEVPDSDWETSIAESATSSGSTLSVNRTAKLRVMFTGIENPPKEELAELSVKTTDSPNQCGLVVATKFTRTVKMMYAVARGIPVVDLKWVNESYKAKRLLDISSFSLRDEAAETKYSFSLAATLRVAAEQRIFDGWTFFVTKSCVPNPEQIKEIVSGCNAKVVNRKPAQGRERTAIVTCASDLPSLGKKHPVPVVGVEFVLNAILQHRIDVKKYTLIK